MLNDERFRAAQRRFEAYWQGEELDRCLIAVTAPVGAPRPARRAAGLEARWTGAEAIYEDFTSGLRATWYGGEALPIHWPNLGPGVVSAFVGGGYRFTEDTVWFSELPGIERMDAFDDLRLDKSGAMYCHAVRLMRTMAERSKGRYLVAMTDLGGGLDIAASLMGVQPMLYAMADEPERVEALLQAIDRAWTDAFRDFCALLAPYQQGLSCWLPVWHPGRTYPLQCDACVMFSPRMFERFALPSLARQAEALDDAIYHLDGEGEIKHLDMILSIPRLKAIEWIPAGRDINDQAHYPLFQRIQAAGVRLILRGIRPDSLERLLANVDSRGLFITMRADSPEQGEEILLKAVAWRRR